MALETGTYISDLVTSNPPQSDSLTQAAGHLRLLKSVIQATFPNINGAISATDEQIDGAATQYARNSFVPAGAICDYAGASLPTGWLWCNGASVLRATYADLFAAIGTTFGSVDATHFNVPDYRDRVAFGKADMGGVADAAIIDSLLTSTILGSTYDGEGAIDTITLAAANIPVHTHTFSAGFSGTTGFVSNDHTHTFSGTTSTAGAHTHTYSKPNTESPFSNAGGQTVSSDSMSSQSTSSDGNHSHTYSGTTSGISANHNHSFSGSVSGTTSSAGSGTAFTVAILPPSLVVNVIIKT